MIAGLAAVITIARRNVIIVGIEPDRAVAHARVQREFLGELPLGLQIGIDVPHQVTLVAAQVSLFTVLRRAVAHNKVFVTFAALAHSFVIKTGGKGDRHQQLAAVGPAGINPLVVTRQVDNAASMGGFELRSARNRLILGGFTFTGVHHHAQIVLLAQLSLVA